MVFYEEIYLDVLVCAVKKKKKTLLPLSFVFFDKCVQSITNKAKQNINYKEIISHNTVYILDISPKTEDIQV